MGLRDRLRRRKQGEAGAELAAARDEALRLVDRLAALQAEYPALGKDPAVRRAMTALVMRGL